MIDLNAFNTRFFIGTFDEEAIYTPSGGTATPITVIFDNEYQVAQFTQAESQIEASGPRATCREADVAGVAHGDALQVRGVVYTVAEVHPDGTGLVVLVLSRDA